MSAAIALMGTLSMHTAYALQAATWINLGSISVEIVDLNTTDLVAPSFILSDYQSGVGAAQWGSSPLYISNQSSSDWTTSMGLTYPSSPPGATAAATFDGQTRTASASVTGSVGGDVVYAGTSNRAYFLLGAWTQITFAFEGRVAMIGSDPYDSTHQAYAIVQAYFQDEISYDTLAYEQMRAEAWLGDEDTTRLFALTVANNGPDAIGGWLDIGGTAETISTIQPTPVPEPAALVLCLAALGMLGAVRRGKHA